MSAAATAPATATKLPAAETAPALAAAGGIMTVPPDGASASPAEGAEMGESRRPAGGDAILGPCAAAQAAAARRARRTKATPRAISGAGGARDRRCQLSEEAWVVVSAFIA
jgi:hypothetical protein